MSDSVQIQLKFFATASDLFGRKSAEVTLPAGFSIGDLAAWLCQNYAVQADRLNGMIFARNHDFVDASEMIQTGDEIGIFPPVSGGSEDLPPTITRITDKTISVDACSAQIVAPHTGAAVVFTGFVRGVTPGTEHPATDRLEYEAYEPMAIKKMQVICSEIRQKWPAVYGIYMVQRVGDLLPMDIAVAIGVSCGHRGEGAFEAARYGIDRLKEIVPVWKKEVGPDGEEWVEGSYHPGAGA
jgi:MoaE-MoaD fusion protein